MIVTSKAPTRIDLAGGTLDIWPLACFFPGSMTINAAIDLYARVTIRKRRDRRIHLISKDTGDLIRASNLVNLKKAKGLELVKKIIQFYSPKSGFTLTTDCDAPPGSGIAGSSALNIALNGALNAYTGSRYSKGKILEIAKNLEASVIGIPTGVQDYYPALYGGLNAIRFSPDGTKRERLKGGLSLLSGSSILCFTGTSRFSGANNWSVFKGAVNGDKKTRKSLKQINQVAKKLYGAILRQDPAGIVAAIREEWKNRRELAGGVSNSKIETLIRVAGKRAKIAAKICGAGGGGFLFVYVEQGEMGDVESALKAAGGVVTGFKFVNKGLAVSVSNS